MIELSLMVLEERVNQSGKKICQKLKENIPQYIFIFDLIYTILMEKKNVTVKCYGGYFTIKKKLLDKQKEGKYKMREVFRVTFRKDMFFSVFKDD
ncbi:unnamed protein product [Paramecium pentaurelia]|uniref:GTP-binding protein LepA C-terminal domain-containing protein n=1 Tax=Paramecium pentaurelia TaxID=43138 RepID=A0A8S1UFU6_9CILI|nr:unnamed protein product [Paramecium pentaurelia]